jgi:UDP-2-acetamido-2,6-beta-L-arabino-hexul-4-ose reductase
MKIVVTGANGFLGTHFIRFLKPQKNICVEVIHHKNSADKYKLKGATHIIHLAGVNRGTKEELKLGNVGYTSLLLSWAQKFAPSASIIYSSSPQVYLKHSYYGETKLLAEKHLQAYAKKNHINCISLRFSNIYGPFCRPFYNSAIATFIFQIMHNKKIIVHGDGKQKRDFIYVTEAIDAIQKAISYNSKKEFQIFDICTSSHISINELIMNLRTSSPKLFRCQYESGTGQLIDWPLKSFNRAKRDLKWMPSISIAQGLKRIFKEEYGII